VSRVSKLIRSHVAAGAVLAALLVVFAIGGCGGDDETTTPTTPTTSDTQTTPGSSAIDSALASCTDAANRIGGAAGTELEGACAFIATGAEQVLSGASENVSQALSDLANSCRNAVGQLPSGQAQDALSEFCDAVASAG
jgi:hypothetical protein